jgi:WD40 repeat protein
MGEVWVGRDLRLRRDVAVKVLRDADPDEEEVSRFVREATVAAGLQHPGITVVFDADVHDGRMFIVTELLSGKDLGQVLAAHPGGLLLVQVLDFGVQLADALNAAHRKGIIHRDLKPANLFVQADEDLPGGRLKVCDFGLARDLGSSSKVTVTGEVFGTPAYMAPEQWRSAPAGLGADLYAAGCILYEMATGRVPFEGPALPDLMAQHLTRPPVPPRDLKPGIPVALNDVVLSLLSKDAASRPASAAEVLAALTRLRNARQASAVAKVQQPQARPRLIRILTGHAGSVSAVAFSPDGMLLGTSSDDRTARLWDTATGQAIRILTGHTGTVTGVAFSPDGTLLATTSNDKTGRLWDVAPGQTIRILSGHLQAVNGVAFSPDGTLLATSGGIDKTARLWDTATGQAIRTLSGHLQAVNGVAFSPDGMLLATSGSVEGTVRLWDTATSRTIRVLAGNTGRVAGVAFSPDGTLLATGGNDKTARLWDTKTSQAVAVLTGHGGTVTGVAFSPDGTLLATSSGDKTARLWDITDGLSVRALSGHAGTVTGVAFSPDGTLLATSSGDGTARLWAVG